MYRFENGDYHGNVFSAVEAGLETGRDGKVRDDTDIIYARIVGGEVLWNDDLKLLTTRLASELLGISIITVQMYCKQRKIKCLRSDGDWYYDIHIGDLWEFAKNERVIGRPISDIVLPINADMSILEDRDKRILEERMRGLSLMQVGELLGISRERVRQRQHAALRQLRIIARMQEMTR